MNPKYKTKLVFEELDGFDAFETDRFHGGEDYNHHMVKCAAAYLINDAGRDVALECDVDGGEVDVLDLGESDQQATAIEIETAYSPQKERDKLEQYRSDLIGEVIVVPAREAPDELDALNDWLRKRLPGV